MERSAPEAGLCLDNKVWGHWKQDKAAIRMLMVERSGEAAEKSVQESGEGLSRSENPHCEVEVTLPL